LCGELDGRREGKRDNRSWGNEIVRLRRSGANGHWSYMIREEKERWRGNII
jgi:hypothetical protein